MNYKKEKLDILMSHSLRDLVDQVNNINSTTPSKILKEDIVELFKDEETFFLLYYK